MFFVPDFNLLQHIKADALMEEEDPVPLISRALQWLLHNVDNYINRREFELFDKRPGALIAGSPKVIWVKMLKRPQELCDTNPIFNLRSKLNNTPGVTASSAEIQHRASHSKY